MTARRGAPRRGDLGGRLRGGLRGRLRGLLRGLLRGGSRHAPLPALVLPMLFWGCGAPDPSADPDRRVEAVGGEAGVADPAPSGPRIPPGVETVRLHLGPGGDLLVSPCVDPRSGTEPRPEPGASPVPAVDASGQDLTDLFEEYGNPDAGIPARVVFSSGSAEAAGGRISALRVALPESAAGTACAQAFPDAEIEASGNEPFWHVRLDDGEILYRTPENQEGTFFHDVTWTRLDGGGGGGGGGSGSGSDAWRMEALRDFVDGIEYLVLEISDTPCIDSMSGARFPWTATIELAGERWPGCAREGRRLAEGPA